MRFPAQGVADPEGLKARLLGEQTVDGKVPLPRIGEDGDDQLPLILRAVAHVERHRRGPDEIPTRSLSSLASRRQVA